MIKEHELDSLLNFDLETAPEYKTFEELQTINPRKAELWKQKHDKQLAKMDVMWSKFVTENGDPDYGASYFAMAPLSPEFGRIVCASFGYIKLGENNVYSCRVKSFYDTIADEFSEKNQVLIPVSEMLIGIKIAMKMTGHNIKKFDIPWLVKRLIINQVEVPKQLQTWGKKPWEVDHTDTGDLWSMGNWDGYVSLDLLSCILGIQSPKENLKGDQVGKTFWHEQGYDKIARYCEEDVKCGVRICHRLSNSKKPLEFQSND